MSSSPPPRRAAAPSRRAPRPLSAALSGFTERLAPDSTLTRVQSAWESVVGPAVSDACRPTGEHEGVLTVSCSESVWSHELQLMGEDIVERLNATLGGPVLKRLKSRVG